ncbi:Hypothetical protein CINCED_3A011718 [Cinara cedri]|uniref:Uncharacterized protein n=1 Tax=Cinara cedri TaxID=506608 RepID=A0A5E4N3S2_9HEMI|nr:Hypothetical protein CINCED_3A011718 [Cinara cedri]
MINDLGITLDQELQFHDHIDKSCCKALKTLRFIKRVSLEFNFISPLKALFCALIRSILEYDVVIRDPSSASSVNHLERIQRKFLSFAAMVLHNDHLPHEYNLVIKRLGLKILADRQISANNVFLRNLKNGSTDCSVLLSLILKSLASSPSNLPVFHSFLHHELLS